MSAYIIRRLLYIIPTFIAITIFIFLFQDLAPGDPTSALLGRSTPVPQEMIQRYKEKFHLDDPIWTRYGFWLWQLLQGNFGRSLKTGERVGPKILNRLSNTIQLMILGITLSTIIGISVGLISGIWQYSVFDYVSTFIIFFSLSIPGFFFGFLAIYAFSIKIPLFPVGGSMSASLATGNPAVWRLILDRLHHLILPASALGLILSAYMARFTRTAVIEVAREQYVTTARAKGLPERMVIIKHIFRNALSPVITVLSNRLRWIVGGSVAIEVVFQYPGVGMLLKNSVLARDYTVIMAVVIIFSAAVLFSFLFADIGYALANPKVRFN